VRFEWNARKAAANLRKHGVPFDEARLCSSIPSRRRVMIRIIRSMNGDSLPLESSQLGMQRERRGNCMRKARTTAADELRAEYERSDFSALVRGKYIERLQESSNVVVIDPAVTDMFPKAAAVNAALRSLAEIAKRAGSRRSRLR
jgi:hypothetical protein